MNVSRTMSLGGALVAVVAASVVAGAPTASAAACEPRVERYGTTLAIHHDGAQLFTRTVDVYNACFDPTWTMDVRGGWLGAPDIKINLGINQTRTYPLSSGTGEPYVAGFKAR